MNAKAAQRITLVVVTFVTELLGRNYVQWERRRCRLEDESRLASALDFPLMIFTALKVLSKTLRFIQRPAAWMFWFIEQRIAKLDIEVQRRRL